MIKFTYYNVLQLPTDLIDFVYMDSIIYDETDKSVILKYSDGTEIDLGTVDPGTASNIVGATINPDGELLFTFDDTSMINAGRVYSDNQVNTAYELGLGSLYKESGTFRSIVSHENDYLLDIYEDDDNFVIDASLPIDQSISQIKGVQNINSHFSATVPIQTIDNPRNTWSDINITNPDTDTIGIDTSNDNYMIIPKGYYYTNCAVPIRTTSGISKFAIRDKDNDITMLETQSAQVHGNSWYVSSFMLSGYFYVDKETSISVSLYTNISDSISIGSPSMFINLWKVSDDDVIDNLLKSQNLIGLGPIKVYEGASKVYVDDSFDSSDVSLLPNNFTHLQTVLNDVDTYVSDYTMSFNRTLSSTLEQTKKYTRNEILIDGHQLYMELTLSIMCDRQVRLSIIKDDDRSQVLYSKMLSTGSHHKINGVIDPPADGKYSLSLSAISGNNDIRIYAEKDDVIASLKLWDITNFINPYQEWNEQFTLSEITRRTPSLAGSGNGVHADEQYVYLAHSNAPFFTVVDKSDWSVVSGTPSLPDIGRDVYADDQYIYLAHTGGDNFTVVDKSDWSIVTGTPSLTGDGFGVYADDQYVYLVHFGGSRFTVVDKSDWSVVSGTPSLPSTGRSVYADEQYVYLGHQNGNRFTVVDKSDWSVVSGTPSLPNTGNGVHADDQYVYLVHFSAPFFTVVDKSDWSVVSGTPSLSGTGYDVYIDEQYVYLAHASDNNFTVVDKSDWSVVSGTPSLSGNGLSIYTDEQFVYVGHNSGNGFSVSKKLKFL